MTEIQKQRRARLTWRKQRNELGLGRIGQPERGIELWYDGRYLGGVYPLFLARGCREERAGYYWYNIEYQGIPRYNSSRAGVSYPDMDTAKADLLAHVKKHMQ